MNERQVIVRPFEEQDRESVRAICRQCAKRDNSPSVSFNDEDIVSMLYADYYMDFEPEACFVAEAGGNVVGYIVGCKDTRRYHRVILARIFPRVCLRVIWKLVTLQYRDRQTYQAMWWGITRGWRETPSVPLDKYPAHLHANMLSDYRGLGIGQALLQVLHEHLVNSGVKGVHAIRIEEENDLTLSNHMRRTQGYELVSVKRYTLWDKVTGKKWYIKLLVREIRDLSRLSPTGREYADVP